MFYQYTHFGTAEYFRKEYGENFSFPEHLHNSFEIITVTSGEMTVTVDNNVYTLKKGESVLVFPNQLHSMQSSTSKHMLCIFSPELVKSYYSKLDKKIPTSNSFSIGDFYIKLLDDILPDSSVIEKKGILYFLCAQFDKNAQYKERSNFDDELLYKVFEFVEQNFTKNCSLMILSNETGYSYSYLSRSFKKTTGISFNTYVNLYRISNACYLLNNTDYSIIRCAMESGYNSLRSFNRNFYNSLGTTPGDYRTKNKTSPNPSPEKSHSESTVCLQQDNNYVR